jgi:signal transduction histidine kinase
VVKHADATKASLIVKTSRKNLHIEVKDNGNGFNLSQSDGKGIGMRSIKNKLHLLKGELEILSSPGKGTKISIQLPLAKHG